MFNPENLLGSLISSGTRPRRKSKNISSLMTGGMALGLFGVAMEAVEHFMNQSPGNASGGPPAKAAVPMPPGSGPQKMPPPPLGATPPPLLPGSAGPADVTDQAQANAVLLIRAMIAAANADGNIDERERQNVMERMQGAELGEEEHRFLLAELSAPQNMEAIVSAVNSPEIARQVYIVSLLAIEVDTPIERGYLRLLADRLLLDAAAVDAIHQELAIEI